MKLDPKTFDPDPFMSWSNFEILETFEIGT